MKDLRDLARAPRLRYLTDENCYLSLYLNRITQFTLKIAKSFHNGNSPNPIVESEGRPESRCRTLPHPSSHPPAALSTPPPRGSKSADSWG